MSKGHRGYIVQEKHLDNLTEELKRCGVVYQFVTEPCKLTNGTHFVLVWPDHQPKPAGWVRYRWCVKHDRPFGLNTLGQVNQNCTHCVRPERTAEHYWTLLERNTPVSELSLPGWFSGFDTPSIWDLRESLNAGTVYNVGTERAEIVSNALAEWRQRVRGLLGA